MVESDLHREAAVFFADGGSQVSKAIQSASRADAGVPHGALVPRTRSSHHDCCKSDCELRVQSGTSLIGFLVSPGIPKFATERAANWANFGIGTRAFRAARLVHPDGFAAALTGGADFTRPRGVRPCDCREGISAFTAPVFLGGGEPERRVPVSCPI